jgi:hypothetical protein
MRMLIIQRESLGGTVATDPNKVAYWRKLEADARAAAERMHNADARRELEAIAERYAILAVRAAGLEPCRKEEPKR